MKMKIKICICGGGSQGHISAGVIGSHNNASVNILTRRPALWTRDFKTVDLDGKEYHASLYKISDNPAEEFQEVPQGRGYYARLYNLRSYGRV